MGQKKIHFDQRFILTYNINIKYQSINKSINTFLHLIYKIFAFQLAPTSVFSFHNKVLFVFSIHHTCMYVDCYAPLTPPHQTYIDKLGPLSLTSEAGRDLNR